MSKLSWVSFCLGLLEFCCGPPAVYFGKLFITAHRKWSFHANDMRLTVCTSLFACNPVHMLCITGHGQECWKMSDSTLFLEDLY